MKSKPFGALFGLLALVAILGVAQAFGQTANEIDMASGAGASAGAACVAANNCFAPNPLTVAPGTTVTWKNTDTVSHYVTSGKASDETTGTVFDSGSLIKPGSTYQFTFANAGTFDYFCSVHPWMTGQVIVAGASANSIQASGSMQAGSMNMTTSQSSNMSQTGSTNMTQPNNTPVQTGSMNVTVSQSSDNATHTGVENTTTSQPSETVANTGSSSEIQSQSNNSPTETNNAQPATPTNTQYASSASVVNTPSTASDAQTSAWVAGIIVVAIMSGVGIWSTARRK